MQRYSFLAALLIYLESEKLALHSDVGELLKGRFHILFFKVFISNIKTFVNHSVNQRGRWVPSGCRRLSFRTTTVGIRNGIFNLLPVTNLIASYL